MVWVNRNFDQNIYPCTLPDKGPPENRIMHVKVKVSSILSLSGKCRCRVYLNNTDVKMTGQPSGKGHCKNVVVF